MVEKKIKNKTSAGKIALGAGFLFVVILIAAFVSSNLFFDPLEYDASASIEKDSGVLTFLNKEEEKKISHVKTPKQVKAIYMSSWVAGTSDFRERLVKLIDETELNSVVIDIKDYTGNIAFNVTDPKLLEIGSFENRIPDIEEFLEYLHSKNIYVIGRVAVFQDPYMVKTRPDLAVKKASDGSVWKDYKGISWIDPGAKEMWEYTVAIAEESYKIGFDEINFDYIRFPSDGNMKDIAYPISNDPTVSKAETIRRFFEYLNKKLAKTGMKTSADLFGMTTTNTDDLNIGQVLENAIPYFDYIAPMVYPSHYPPSFNGYKNPAAVPYEIIEFSMSSAVDRLNMASSTPLKLRPWLQDFDLGAVYTPEMVRAQIQATYDVGLDSWMLWDPSNKYTREALLGAE